MHEVWADLASSARRPSDVFTNMESVDNGHKTDCREIQSLDMIPTGSTCLQEGVFVHTDGITFVRQPDYTLLFTDPPMIWTLQGGPFRGEPGVLFL